MRVSYMDIESEKRPLMGFQAGVIDPREEEEDESWMVVVFASDDQGKKWRERILILWGFMSITFSYAILHFVYKYSSPKSFFIGLPVMLCLPSKSNNVFFFSNNNDDHNWLRSNI